MRSAMLAAICACGWLAWAPLAVGASSSPPADPSVILNENSIWRQYYRFDVNRISPALMKAEGAALLGPKLADKAKQDAEFWIGKLGLAKAGVAWQDHVLLANRGMREFLPTPAPLPAPDWAKADFDDSAWVRERHPFQGGPAAVVTNEVLGQYEESVDLKLQAAFYRGRFLVDDPQKAGALTVKLSFNGGARVLINGRELGRKHLPPGELPPGACADDYPAATYTQGGDAARRTLGPLPVPADALVKGCNVLAIEIRASHIHPVLLKNPIQPNWGGPRRPFPHGRLLDVELRGSGGDVRAGKGAAELAQAAGAAMQVWVEDIHHRVETTDCPVPGELPGVVRFVGARNGAYCAQIVLRGSAALTGIKITPSELAHTGGATKLPSAALTVAGLAPYPLEEFSAAKLGDERGLNATFPSQAALAQAESAAGSKPCLFDHLTPEPPAMVAANAARPFWLTLSVPADAAPGTYKGTIEVSAAGTPAVNLPVVAEVADWALPQPRDFRTLVGCEENPYAVARQYNVAPWSEKHFKLLEASFRQLGRVGNKWLNVPVLRNTEFGNKDDSPVKITKKRDGSLAFDYAVLDRYLDLALRYCGPPRVIHVIVMQGMKPAGNAPAPPEVSVFAEGAAQPQPVNASSGPGAQLWTAIAKSLYGHLQARGFEQAMFWGAPLEAEADPGLKTVLAAAVPSVGWTAGPHEMMYNGTFAKAEQFYKLVADIRYQGGWQSFRDDQGWKSKTIHLLNPRVGGTCFALHTTSYPLAYRVLPDRALAMGRGGFTRVGADEWAATHYGAMAIPKWLTGVPVLFVLWPGKDGAEPSVRFEMLREGIQEAEARVFIEQALDAGTTPPQLAARAKQVLADHFRGTDFFIGNSVMFSLERNHYGWQERSAKLFAMAAEVGKVAR
ncbi:MAG: hypothetical protein NTW87_01460 [Planctomycetota bacterium]|nr:hypothetical protein [Planctomycetota bacterium]